jgi:GSH-dependent disulfide-bond oxidoreductase
VSVDTTKRGEQHAGAFRTINPNGEPSTIVDIDGGIDVRVIDSTAILLYLGEKTG